MKTRHIWLVSALAAGGLALGACATHEDVEQAVAAHNAENQQQFSDVNARVDQVKADAQAALARAEEAHKLAEGNFQHAVLFTDDSVKFATGSSALSPDAQASLTAFADKIKADNKNVYIEVQGHTDVHGSAARNHKLGHARADAVVDFLHNQGIPLYHLSPTSYGEDKPSGQGDAEDRRVVLVVMN